MDESMNEFKAAADAFNQFADRVRCNILRQPLFESAMLYDLEGRVNVSAMSDDMLISAWSTIALLSGAHMPLDTAMDPVQVKRAIEDELRRRGIEY